MDDKRGDSVKGKIYFYRIAEVRRQIEVLLEKLGVKTDDDAYSLICEVLESFVSNPEKHTATWSLYEEVAPLFELSARRVRLAIDRAISRMNGEVLERYLARRVNVKADTFGMEDFKKLAKCICETLNPFEEDD